MSKQKKRSTLFQIGDKTPYRRRRYQRIRHLVSAKIRQHLLQIVPRRLGAGRAE
jgi:hypothetical protein